MSKTKFINAIYDLGTGKAMLSHPTKENVFVSPAHYKEITSDMHEESNCTYTDDTVCTLWVKDPNGPGLICAHEVDVHTCNCSCDQA